MILCDLLMPEMTGMDLSRALNRIAPDLAARMIFMTGGAYTPTAREFRLERERRSVVKPVDADELRELVRAIAP